MRSSVRMLSGVVSIALLPAVACHHSAPTPTVIPASSGAENVDAARERAAARARADAARRDSLARANARADSVRRAEDAARAAEDARRVLLEPVHFDFDRDEIRATDAGVLERKVSILRDNPSLSVRIEGNADDRGSDEYNLALGMRRAAAVERFITERGIAGNRMTTASNGVEKPVCTERADACWSQNRRDDVVITSGGAHLVP